jgi:multiple sugar transport system permease protein
MDRNGLLSRGGTLLRWAAALAICGLFLLPILWVLSIALKPPDEWLAYPPRLVPAQITLENFLALFRKGNPVGGISEMVSSAEPVTPAFLNSLLVVPIATLASLTIGFLASYGVTRYRAGGPGLPLFVLTTRMFPPVAFAVPLLVYFRALGLIDTQLALVLMYTGFTIAFSLWMMRGFIEGVPRHIEEAAILDGASPWRVLPTITLPLVKGGLAATGLFVFILNWTEFLLAQVFTSREAITLPVQVTRYTGAVGRFYGPMAALGIVASIPVVIAGYLIQRHLVTGFTFGLVRK